jgi:hypothetical protein
MSMTVAQLATIVNAAVEAGKGDARVMFDTDAACYRVHLVEVRACMEDAETTVDGQPMLLLSTPDYHGICEIRRRLTTPATPEGEPTP